MQMDNHHEANAQPADDLRPGGTDEVPRQEHTDDFVWRRFLTFYDSLQWQMYL